MAPPSTDSEAEGVGSAFGATVDEARIALTNLRQQASPGVLLPPIILLVGVFVIAYVLRPSTATPAEHADYQTFFSAAATVLGTILIAVVVQANLFRGPSLRRMLICGLLYIALGEAAALMALLPGGSDHLKGVLFALTTSASVGALVAVVWIGIRLLEEPTPELEIQADGSAVLEDSPMDMTPAPASEESDRPAGGERETDTRSRRDRPRGSRPRRGGQEPAVVLHADAVADLEKLGRRETALVLAITERILGNERARQKRTVRVDGEWSEVRAGSLRIVFRPLTEAEATERGITGGSMVRRILGVQAAREWLTRTAAENPRLDRPGRPG